MRDVTHYCRTSSSAERAYAGGTALLLVTLIALIVASILEHT